MESIKNFCDLLVRNKFVWVMFFAACMLAPEFAAHGTMQTMSLAMIAVIFGLSMFVLAGLAGELSIGHAALLGGGAYAAAITATRLMPSIFLTIPAGIVAGIVLAALLALPARKVSGFYLAMVTLGFGEIFFEITREWSDVTGGVMGLRGIPTPMLKTLNIWGNNVSIGNFFRALTVVTIIVMFLGSNIQRSRFGRAMAAVKVNTLAAESLGIGVWVTRQTAYLLSGGLAGLAGAFYAHLMGYIGPQNFDIMKSIEILIIVIVGGMTSIAGQAMSAFFFTFLPFLLQAFSNYQFILYGIILMFTVIVFPEGVAGLILKPPRYRFQQFRRTTRANGQTLAAPERRINDGHQGGELTIHDLTVRFGGLTAVDKFTMVLRKGETVGLVGPNGSGKSTIINSICGVYEPQTGNVDYQGEILNGKSESEIARMGVVRTFQDAKSVPFFTVKENLLLGLHGRLKYGIFNACIGTRKMREQEQHADEACDSMLVWLGIEEFASKLINDVPYGIRRLTDLGRAVLMRPDILLLDEPAAGLTEPEMATLQSVIRKLQVEGIGILIIEHHIDFLSSLVDRMVVINNGKLIFSGSAEDMLNNPEVVAAYIGEEH